MVNSLREIHNKCVTLHRFGLEDDSFLKNLPLEQTKMLKMRIFSPLIFSEYLQHINSTATSTLDESRAFNPLLMDEEEFQDLDNVVPSLCNLSTIDIRQGLNKSAPDQIMLFLNHATHYLNTFQTKLGYAAEDIPPYIMKYKSLFTRSSYEKFYKRQLDTNCVQVYDNDIVARFHSSELKTISRMNGSQRALTMNVTGNTNIMPTEIESGLSTVQKTVIATGSKQSGYEAHMRLCNGCQSRNVKYGSIKFCHCYQNKTVDERKEVLRKRNICFHCFRVREKIMILFVR